MGLMSDKMHSLGARHKSQIKQRSWLPSETVPKLGTMRLLIQASTQTALIHTSSPLELVITPKLSGLTPKKWAVAGSTIPIAAAGKTPWWSVTMLSVVTWLQLQCTSREQHAHLAQQGSVVMVTVFVLPTMLMTMKQTQV